MMISFLAPYTITDTLDHKIQIVCIGSFNNFANATLSQSVIEAQLVGALQLQ
jgi:hypothetical protein